ncbi:MAG: alpha/beta hydrolase [Bacteroidales bacterium]
MSKFKFIPLIIVFFFMNASLFSQNYRLNLYPDGEIPNFQPTDEVEQRDTTDIVRIRTVQTPDIAVFLPSKKTATGEAVVICPGGGYWILAYDWEGEDIAKFWNSKGVAAIVLKYRLPTSESQVIPHKSPLMDAQRAMRLVRYNAEKWNIDPGKIGIMGFSAGGHLASTLSTHFDYGNPDAIDPVERLSCRPDFSMLIYPVISFTENFQHSGSHKALLGENSDPELSKYYSNELQVTEDTPPAILIHSSDDKSVPVDNSIVYYKALLNNGINAEMHIYPYGGHGYGLAVGEGYLSTWPERCYDWLKSLE